MIRSRASLSYADAQQKIDAQANGGGGDDALSSSLGILHSLALKLQAERIAGGALRLASPEVKFEKAADGGAAAAVASVAASEGASEVDGAVHAAGVELDGGGVHAARQRDGGEADTGGLPAVGAPPPPPTPAGGRLCAPPRPAPTPRRCARPLVAHRARGVARRRRQAQRAVLQPARPLHGGALPSAEYVCAGEMASLNESTYHFGLATPLYTHFTSPIRRYADQVVHRMAAVAVGWDEPSEELADAPRLGELARSLNERHQAAKQAERASVSLHALRFFRAEPVVADAYATFVTAQGYLPRPSLRPRGVRPRVAARRRAVALPLQRLGEDAVVSGADDPHPRPRDGAHRRRHVAAPPAAQGRTARRGERHAAPRRPRRQE